MTRETKIGLLLGMGVILLIGIIISDQLSQVQQGDPADFTGFAAESQRSIDISDATPAPGYTPIPAPGQPRNTPSTGPSTVTDVPNEFFIPDDVRTTLPQRQADATPGAGGPSSLTIYNVDDMPNPLPPRSDDGVATLVIGTPQTGVPHYVQNTPAPTPPPVVAERTPETRTAPTGGVSVIRHTVQADESLIKIARRYYGSDAYWRTIALANPDKVTRDGGVRAGAVLNIPKRDDAVLGLDIESAMTERQVRVDTRVASSAGGTIEVQPGDTLSELASKHLGTATRWEELLEANKDQIDGPQGLRVGMKLKLPGGSPQTQVSNTTNNTTTARASNSGKTYTVRPGDNLTQIAERTLRDGDKWKLIYEANRDKLKSPDRLVVGQELKIPAPG